jgi:hypothetical protein
VFGFDPDSNEIEFNDFHARQAQTRASLKKRKQSAIIRAEANDDANYYTHR